MDIIQLKSWRNHELQEHINHLQYFFGTIGYEYIMENKERKIKSGITINTSRNLEIYVSRIPPAINETHVFNLFSRAGIIYELRMMFTFENLHRGYAYISYFDASSAKRALNFHKYLIDGYNSICVCKSINNCCLYFGKIPNDVKCEDFEERLEHMIIGIKQIFFPKDILDENLNRGYAFVKFSSHKLAAIAKKTLSFKSFEMNGHGISVDWAKPYTEIDEEYMKTVTRLYLYNLSLAITNTDVRRHIGKLTKEPRAIRRVFKSRDFCFVHFADRYYAQQALDLLEGTYLADKLVHVTWANPLITKDFIDPRWMRKVYKSIPSDMKMKNPKIRNEDNESRSDANETNSMQDSP